MEPICFYSKYSEQSKKFKDAVKDKINIQFCCVDNKNIRKRILMNKKLHISHVPCIIIRFTQWCN